MFAILITLKIVFVLVAAVAIWQLCRPDAEPSNRIMKGLVIIMIILAAALFLCHGGPAKADGNRQDRLVLLLARTCVAEVDFRGDIAECELMWTINQRNATKRGRSLEKQTLKFNSYWKSRPQRERRPWIMHLDGQDEPRGWSKNYRWERYVHKWTAVRSAAEAFVHSHRQFWHDCPDALDYGAPGESPKSSIEMSRVRCINGESRQRYWVPKHTKNRNGTGATR